jgi:hypothetical protein
MATDADGECSRRGEQMVSGSIDEEACRDDDQRVHAAHPRRAHEQRSVCCDHPLRLTWLRMVESIEHTTVTMERSALSGFVRRPYGLHSTLVFQWSKRID